MDPAQVPEAATGTAWTVAEMAEPAQRGVAAHVGGLFGVVNQLVLAAIALGPAAMVVRGT